MPNLRPLRTWLLRIGVLALIFSAQRGLFALLNHDAFPAPPLSVFLGGIRFDLSAIAWLYLPWTLSVLLMPAPAGKAKLLQKGLFHLSNAICFFLNSVDLEYFKFTLKRSTADLLGIAGGGNDLASLAPVFVMDYWYVVLIFLASMAAAEIGYRWTGPNAGDGAAKPWWAWRLPVVALVALLSRGGVQYIPLTVLDASQYAAPAYMPLVLNTPFTVMTSIGKPTLEGKHYMDDVEADRLWPVVHQYGEKPASIHRPNVVVIVLESFSGAYSGRLNGTGEGYMPFLDSLMGQGLWYSRAYSNGRRSVDGIPAVLASLPKMMPEAFIESPYAQQPFTSLPGLLANEGYATSFFHGGRNGTMGFDAFASSAGFRRYVGRNEYPDAKDDDGVWGIRDRPFLQFFAQELARERQPFMSCLFTLSSHHPYRLPDEEAARFGGGELPIMATLRYSDDAVRQFFATARTMPWFNNTLFIITADHTADLLRQGETSGSAFDHWIPLFYYMPDAIAPQHEDRVTQQIDILPTVLDLMGYPKPFFAFGSSSLRMERPPASISESNATWLLVGGECQLRTDGHTVLWAEGVQPDTAMDATCPDRSLPLLQAAIQQFNNHLLRGDMAAPRR
ncbi:MAG TPA: LTA synthase family protein [Flavobacteriales bacterium]|nr:LTA synthase family protein [Flavobacteriales bacterium]